MFDLAASYSKGVKSVSLRVFFPTWRWGELFRSLSVALREPMEAWYADPVAFAFLAPMAPSERQRRLCSTPHLSGPLAISTVHPTFRCSPPRTGAIGLLAHRGK